MTGLRNALPRTAVTNIAGKDRFTLLNRADRAGGLPKATVAMLGAEPDMVIPDLGNDPGQNPEFRLLHVSALHVASPRSSGRSPATAPSKRDDGGDGWP